MVSYLDSVLATTNAAAVLFDLRQLQYTSGDAIGGLAAALLKEPELLVLDEPTNGLDPAGMAEMRSLIRGLRELGAPGRRPIPRRATVCEPARV